MTLLAIDPGSRHVGAVLLRLNDRQIELLGHRNESAAWLMEAMLSARRETVFCWPLDGPAEHLVGHVAIEHIGHYGRGMPAGTDVFETCYMIGELRQMIRPKPFSMVSRKDVKLHLCGSSQAKDPNVRQALIDRWGGNLKAIGGKKCQTCKGKGWKGRGRPECHACQGSGWEVAPGPLYGVTGHAWSALAVGVYWLDKHRVEKR